MCISVMVFQGHQENAKVRNRDISLYIAHRMILKIYHNCNNKVQIVGTKSNTYKCLNHVFLS